MEENTDSRLQNNTVLGLYCDADNNVWAALDEGIAYIQNNSLVYYYEPPYRKIGMVYDVLVKEDEAYIASIKDFIGLGTGLQSLFRDWKSRHGLLVNGENRFYVDIIKELFRYRAYRHRWFRM